MRLFTDYCCHTFAPTARRGRVRGSLTGSPSCSGKGHAGSHGHPIEGLAARGDSTLANATVHRTVAPGFGNSLSRAKPELVSNPPKSKIPPPKGDGIFGASLGIYPARGYKLRLPGGKTAKEKDTKRYLPLLVPRWGFEPQTPCLKGRCSTY